MVDRRMAGSREVRLFVRADRLRCAWRPAGPRALARKTVPAARQPSRMTARQAQGAPGTREKMAGSQSADRVSNRMC